MAEEKFTKGPWHIDFTDEIYDSDGNNLADAWMFDIKDPETYIANAHLIAAAPELYEALELALEIMDEAGWNRPIQRVARDALAKARGEQCPE